MKILFDHTSPAWFDAYLGTEWMDQFHAYIQTQTVPEGVSHYDYMITCAENFYPPRGIGCRRVGNYIEFELEETPELTMRVLKYSE
jgi:hypothetical protein